MSDVFAQYLGLCRPCWQRALGEELQQKAAEGKPLHLLLALFCTAQQLRDCLLTSGRLMNVNAHPPDQAARSSQSISIARAVIMGSKAQRHLVQRWVSLGVCPEIPKWARLGSSRGSQVDAVIALNFLSILCILRWGEMK